MTSRGKVWAGALIAVAIAWLLQPFYVRNFEAVMEKRGWDQTFNQGLDMLPGLGAEMSGYLNDLFSGTFWLGAFAILAIWGCFEFWSAHRRRERPVGMDNKSQILAVTETKEPAIAIDQAAFDDLELFVVDHLMPACYSLIHLQNTMIEKSGATMAVIELAKGGMLSNWRLREFSEGMDVLSGFGESPARIPTSEALVDAVDRIEKNYQFLCDQAASLARESGARSGTDQKIDQAYEQWRRHHNGAVAAYDRIKKDPRFKRDEILKKLHRPIRQTRLGKAIGDARSGNILLIVPPAEAPLGQQLTN